MPNKARSSLHFTQIDAEPLESGRLKIVRETVRQGTAEIAFNEGNDFWPTLSHVPVQRSFERRWTPEASDRFGYTVLASVSLSAITPSKS